MIGSTAKWNYANLRPVARNYVKAGAARLVIAGVVETRAARHSYQDALGVPLLICRLRVAVPVVRGRLVRRHADDDVALCWHVDRAGELDGILGLPQSRTSSWRQPRAMCRRWPFG